jgi:hypothetical protein
MSVYLATALPEPGASIVFTVYEDVRDGLAEYLHPVSFDVDGPFAAAGALVADRFAVVQWVFVGVDDGKGFNNLWPTAKTITVRGVTIVDMGKKNWEYHRHIDWNGVSSQLGGSLGRSATPLLVKKPEDALFYASAHYSFEDPD